MFLNKTSSTPTIHQYTLHSHYAQKNYVFVTMSFVCRRRSWIMNSRLKGKKSSVQRLRKPYQSVESDDDDYFHLFARKKVSRRVLGQAMDDGVDRGAGDARNKNGDG